MVMRAGATLLVAFVLATAARAEAPKLDLPIACDFGKTCWVQQYSDHDPSLGAQDYACGTQTYDGHDGIDIRVRDTMSIADVIAAASGTVKSVRDGMTDRILRSEADRKAIAKRECGNGILITHAEGWETQYCHLRQGSIAVKPGDAVQPGTRLGSVGYSGMVEFPHVHLTVRKDGKPIDPFRSGDTAENCGGSLDPMWSERALAVLAYHRGEVIRTGFAAGPVSFERLEDGSLPDDPLNTQWPAIVAYFWAINLEEGDDVSVTLIGPEGVSASNSVSLDRAKAQYMLFAGKKRPAAGWPKGVYTGRLEVRKGGVLRLEQQWQSSID